MDGKLCSVETWINPKTGEERKFVVQEIKYKDSGFEKIWLKTLLNSLDITGSKKTTIVNYLIKHRNRSENIIIATQRKIAKETNISLPIVTQTIKSLRKTHFLKLVQNGVYMINPSAIVKGDKNKRIGLMTKFSYIKDPVKNSSNFEETQDQFKKFNDFSEPEIKKKKTIRSNQNTEIKSRTKAIAAQKV